MYTKIGNFNGQGPYYIHKLTYFMRCWKSVGRLGSWTVGRLGSWAVGQLDGWAVGQLEPWNNLRKSGTSQSLSSAENTGKKPRAHLIHISNFFSG